jgi:predicted branched-subunit amino acid permease
VWDSLHQVYVAFLSTANEGWTSYQTHGTIAFSAGNQVENAKRAALKLALADLFLMFVISVIWNYIRKNGVSVIDEFGVAALTAIFVYAFARK